MAKKLQKKSPLWRRAEIDAYRCISNEVNDGYRYCNHSSTTLNCKLQAKKIPAIMDGT